MNITLIGTYQSLVVWYLISLLYLYPYGISVSDEASLRVPDLLAVLAILVGVGAILLRRQVKIDRAFLGVAGAFVLLELFAPFVGAIGYRRPIDVVSALRMAMLWLPMIFLTMLAPSWRALRFEKNLAQVLVATLWLNFAYAVMQIAAAVGAVPQSFLVTAWLEPWAVDENYKIIQGLRPAGFFANSTALSVFGIVCLCFFYARFVSNGARQDLRRSLLSIGIVILSTSRTAYATGAAILFAGWWHLSTGRKSVLAAILICSALTVLLIVEETIGLEHAFYRFQRLAESSLLEDVSFGARVYQSWPTAIEAARDYTFGTLIQAPRALPLIDSGYLNYYLQGKWLFVAALAILLAGHWFLGLRAFFGRESQRLGVTTLFLAIYLTAALVVSNPLRSPLMIFFIVYSLWRLRVERQGRPMEALPFHGRGRVQT
ncbi:MAG: hypothetical protein ACREQZ_09010 [Woeseiaceae bacterium]